MPADPTDLTALLAHLRRVGGHPACMGRDVEMALCDAVEALQAMQGEDGACLACYHQSCPSDCPRGAALSRLVALGRQEK